MTSNVISILTPVVLHAIAMYSNTMKKNIKHQLHIKRILAYTLLTYLPSIAKKLANCSRIEYCMWENFGGVKNQ